MMTFGYRSTCEARMRLHASTLEEDIFPPENFLWKKFKKQIIEGGGIYGEIKSQSND